jgi:hypothetical protein
MRSAGSSAPSSGKGSSSSAASTSARGGGGQWARKGSASARPFEPRTVSLAEVLAHRLEEEPHELDAVWSEIVSRRLEVGKSCRTAACARRTAMHLDIRPTTSHLPLPLFPSLTCPFLSSLQVDARAADALFRACARSSQQSGMPQALRLLREASAKGLLSGPNRSAALVSLLTWWVQAYSREPEWAGGLEAGRGGLDGGNEHMRQGREET